MRDLSILKNQISELPVNSQNICPKILKFKNMRLSLINNEGKVLCHSTNEFESQKSFIDLEALKIEPLFSDETYLSYKFKDHFKKKSYLALLMTIKTNNSLYYLRETLSPSLTMSLRKLRTQILVFSFLTLFLIFFVFTYSILRTEGHIFYRVKRLRRRLNSKGIYTATSINKDNSIIDEIGLIDHQINQTISTLKSLSKNQAFEKEKLQSLLDSLNIGIISIDSKQEILFSNVRAS